MAKVFATCTHYIYRKRLIRSTQGHIGIGPPSAEAGDEICVLLGCRTPLVLRPMGNGNFLLVGGCTPGIKDGEDFLGPLPRDIYPLRIHRPDLGAYFQGFVTRSTAGIFYMDPRFESLCLDRGFDEDSISRDPGAKTQTDFEALKQRGVRLRCFDIE